MNAIKGIPRLFYINMSKIDVGGNRNVTETITAAVVQLCFDFGPYKSR